MNYSVREIATIVNGKLKESRSAVIEEIVIDTRAFFHAEKTIFVALNGIKRDGHTFLEVAHKKGIRNFLVQEIPNFAFKDANYILVPNTLIALQQLATNHRQQFNLTAIGVTGSHGKTMVKEWLYQLLCQDFEVVKSPKSYNSQLGVPLSVLGIEKNHTHGIFEAGISEPNEMPRLASIIKPNIGIITNITTAHLQNFESYLDLVNEKIAFIKNCNKIIVNGDNDVILSKIKQLNPTAKIYSWGKSDEVSIKLIETEKQNNGTKLSFRYKEITYEIYIPFADNASIENTATLFSTLAALELDVSKFIDKFKSLTPIEMRLEINEGTNNCVVINDGYNSDLHSIKVALEVLVQQKKINKTVILSSINETENAEKNYKTITKWINESDISKVILVGAEITKYLHFFNTHYKSYNSTEEFLENLYLENFSNEAILVKGAYSYNFNKISDALTLRSHDTIMEINLHALVSNFHQFKSKLKPKTKVMCMVKAYGYGTGSYEIAQSLEYNGVDYLGVAYADEGAALRKNGISLPIMVMNPEQSSYDIVIKNQLEPEIYSFRVLDKFLHALTKYYLDKPYAIHIKLDTGMNRLGFKEAEIPLLQAVLATHKDKVEVVSVFTHLAASEDLAEAEFTLSQFALFEKLYGIITKDMTEKPIRHVLNSAGILNYTDYQYDMVRLGIGLYGFVSIDSIKLNAMARFKTVISQIKTLKKGESIGYNRRFVAKEDKTIAVLPVGYADGIHRNTGNEKGSVSINSQKAVILGNICMDTLMIDITNIKCQEGDEVCIFGESPTIEEVAKIAGTIPYEILTSVSQRVKRVYYKE